MKLLWVQDLAAETVAFLRNVRYLMFPLLKLICLHAALDAFDYSISWLLATPQNWAATKPNPAGSEMKRKQSIWSASRSATSKWRLGGEEGTDGPESRAEQQRVLSDVAW